MSMNFTPQHQIQRDKELHEAGKLEPVDRKIDELLKKFDEYPNLKTSQKTIFTHLLDIKKLIAQWRANKVPTTHQETGKDTNDLIAIKRSIGQWEIDLNAAIDHSKEGTLKHQKNQ